MLFSIPYNNSDPEEYLELFNPYLEHVHSVYFGLPGVFAAHNPSPAMQSADVLVRYTENTYRFLEAVKGRIDTVLCINTLIYPETENILSLMLTREMGPLVEEYGLSAVNVASPTLAEVIQRLFPYVDIQTSCNTYTFLGNTYRLWHERFGSTVFNLPREALRTPALLENFKKLGYTSKAIVNEGCIYGCPGNIEHSSSFVQSKCTMRLFCEDSAYTLSDIFKSNFVPPHLLRTFEGRLDIAKIAGRTFTTENIFKAFHAYLTGDEQADIGPILHSRASRLIRDNRLTVRSKDWPTKTLTCECKQCAQCTVCNRAMSKVIEANGIDTRTLTCRI